MVIDQSPTYNVTRMNVETACNKISKIKPKVTFLTKGGDHEKRALAKELDLYCLNQFKKGNIWGVGRRSFKDACSVRFRNR